MARDLRRGQNLAEYALIIAVVGLALAAMQTYFKRGIQSIAKISADELSRNATKLYCDTYGDIDSQSLGSISTSLLNYTSDQSVISGDKKIRTKEYVDNGFVKETDIQKDTSTFVSSFNYTTGYNPGVKQSKPENAGGQTPPMAPPTTPQGG